MVRCYSSVLRWWVWQMPGFPLLFPPSYPQLNLPWPRSQNPGQKISRWYCISCHQTGLLLLWVCPVPILPCSLKGSWAFTCSSSSGSGAPLAFPLVPSPCQAWRLSEGPVLVFKQHQYSQPGPLATGLPELTAIWWYAAPYLYRVWIWLCQILTYCV